MLTIFMAIAAAYFVGLGAMGFLFVLGSLQIQREHGKLSGPVWQYCQGSTSAWLWVEYSWG
ncbi:MAG: hypothetical protein ABI167_11235 [Nitrosospira sp.]